MSTKAIAGKVARRAYNRVGADIGFKNVERLLLYGALIAGAVIIGKVVGIGRKAGQAVDKAATKAAELYVAATAGPVIQAADGITYILPGGAKIAANKTKPLGGGVFEYLGYKYKLVAASPPGSGFYTAVRA